ncbi:MAG: hypothetical protein KatS3mg002_0671 [Candidatus Woesearchaeota archaeon]|nr:MAG: hypothetical protein KatS3mg002_0671 [Candidatus Woesearchaeota archaeon]
MYDSNKRKALEHITELFAEADAVFDEHPELSKRYVVIARKTAMKYKVRFDKSQKLSFCKRCNSFLKKGVNSTIRIHNGRLILTCKECGFVRRFVFK